METPKSIEIIHEYNISNPTIPPNSDHNVTNYFHGLLETKICDPKLFP